jgi:DNA-binding NtrC family response regulator
MGVVLEGDGYAVLRASSAEEAHAICAAHGGPIQLMVTDAALRSLTGKQLARRIAEIRPEMKVLYVSGYSRAELIAKGELDQDMPFIQKPFTGDVLAKAVRRLLDGGAPGSQRLWKFD